MKIELECCGFKPASMEVSTNVPTAKLITLRNKIVIETSNETIRYLTVKRRSIYNNRLCYLNIVNPVYYLYQYKLKNDDIYFYDDDFLWMDIVFSNVIDTNLELKLTKERNQFNGSSGITYNVATYGHKKYFNIVYHNMPQIQILRYKRTNILSQLFWSILISSLAIWQLCVNSENMFLYLSAIAILLVISGAKIFKYYSSKSIKQFFNKTL